MLTVIEFSEGDFGVRINKCLLIDPADSLNGTNVIGVLRSKITRVMCFDFPMSGFLFLGPFQSNYLSFGKDYSICTRPGFQCF